MNSVPVPSTDVLEASRSIAQDLKGRGIGTRNMPAYPNPTTSEQALLGVTLSNGTYDFWVDGQKQSIPALTLRYQFQNLDPENPVAWSPYDDQGSLRLVSNDAREELPPPGTSKFDHSQALDREAGSLRALGRMFGLTADEALDPVQVYSAINEQIQEARANGQQVIVTVTQNFKSYTKKDGTTDYRQSCWVVTKAGFRLA